jgi:uncharacterized protein YjbI with pentapeptide repeats
MTHDEVMNVINDARREGVRPDFRRSDLSRAELTYADLRRVDFRRSNLSYADLRRSDLSHADLRRSDLRHADFRGADLSCADLRGADLTFCVGNGKEIQTIQTNKWPIIISESYMAIGCEQHPIRSWLSYSEKKISKMDPDALEFWKQWKPAIIEILKSRGYNI